MRVMKSRRIIILNKKESFHIPFGLVHAYKEFITKEGAELKRDKNNILCLHSKEKTIQLYPCYSKKTNIKIDNKALTFTIVNSEIDKRACQRLMLTEHYLPPPTRGVYFALKKQNKIIACCVLDILNFGNPKGRFYIDKNLSESFDIDINSWGSTPLENHAKLQKSLQLIWVSRIARDTEYKNMRLGSTLIQEILSAIPSVFPQTYKYIELIRTLPSMKSESLDFLNEIGFKNVTLTKNKPMPYLDSTTELFPKAESCDKVYYWSKVPKTGRLEIDRVFIPLSTSPFKWFSSGEKKWELRRIGGQYNTQNIYKGRPVELRRGYNSDQLLWGVIDSTILSQTIEEAIEAVGDFKSIIPTAKSKHEAAKISYEILKPSPNDRFIVFSIVEVISPDFE
ncbi:hypothetical protein M5G22_05835 [Pseudomonas sp. TNT2022 ID233]|uniref:hypothetical protein n=1 Tax=Pseudomonas aphyarum TaxID=2942629 RepID=UPI002361849E|nr:hypothetical protein [Pseudomonas aphyarum]MDD1137070.1 hypothetical protein [Pseudomonas aphyarum]